MQEGVGKLLSGTCWACWAHCHLPSAQEPPLLVAIISPDTDCAAGTGPVLYLFAGATISLSISSPAQKGGPFTRFHVTVVLHRRLKPQSSPSLHPCYSQQC